MVAANGMNAVSMMFERIKQGGNAGEGMRIVLIPTIDTLKVVGVVHMPGIFVGMVLDGSPSIHAGCCSAIDGALHDCRFEFHCLHGDFLLMNHGRKESFDDTSSDH